MASSDVNDLSAATPIPPAVKPGNSGLAPYGHQPRYYNETRLKLQDFGENPQAVARY